MTTDVLIDVDGVINALGRKAASLWGWSPESLRQKRIMGYSIAWSSEFLESLAALHEREDVEVFWLTTWLDEAVDQLSHHAEFEAGKAWTVLGHEPFKRDNPWTRGKPGLPQNVNDWWKLDAAQEHFTLRQNRFVWIDDDLRFSAEANEWVASLQTGAAHTLSPSSGTGVTKDEWQKVLDWIDGA